MRGLLNQYQISYWPVIDSEWYGFVLCCSKTYWNREGKGRGRRRETKRGREEWREEGGERGGEGLLMTPPTVVLDLHHEWK